MPIDELLKRYSGYGSDEHVKDPASTGAAKKNLRSSSVHKGSIQRKFALYLLEIYVYDCPKIFIEGK